jgi:hypothetical protein
LSAQSRGPRHSTDRCAGAAAVGQIRDGEKQGRPPERIEIQRPFRKDRLIRTQLRLVCDLEDLAFLHCQESFLIHPGKAADAVRV